MSLAIFGALPASAFGWAEVATPPIHGVATCLRAAGAGGLFSILGPVGSASVTTELLNATRAGAAPVASARFGSLAECAIPGANASGGAVLSGPALSAHTALQAAIRDPGGDFAPAGNIVPVTKKPEQVGGPAVAVGPRGDAVAAWVQTRYLREGVSDTTVLAARRRPAAAFGPAATLAHWRVSEDGGQPKVAAAVDGNGVATVVWARGIPPRRDIDDVSEIDVASAAPGGAFGAAQRLDAATQDVGTLDLEAAPNGDALVVYDGNSGVHAFERPPGAVMFASLGTLSGRQQLADQPAVSLRDDGAAVVAWRFSDLDKGDAGGVAIARRTAPGQFGTAGVIVRPHPAGSSEVIEIAEITSTGPPPDFDDGPIRTALANDGRVLVTWIAPRFLDGDAPPTPWATLGSLGGPFTAPRPLGSPCRSANSLIPLAAADGPAAAWTDNTTTFDAPGTEVPSGAGRLHLALHDMHPVLQIAPPRARLNGPRRARLTFRQPLHVRVGCDRPCDVRAFVPEGAADTPRALGTGTLTARRTAILTLSPGISGLIRRPPAGIGRVVLHACAAGSDRMTSRTIRVRFTRPPVPPLAVPIGVTARRHGHRIVVTWRTRIPARDTDFSIAGSPKRRLRSLAGVVTAARRGHGRTRFHVVLRERPRHPIHYVTVGATSISPPVRQRQVVVRVR